ncbi:MAG TPA: AI-2E family transporter [Gemmatimonadales bacterium]|nr:AI-2E family transporter [Gemmatimonadales bacterium]
MERITRALNDREAGLLRVLLAGACLVIIVTGLKAAAPIVNVMLLGLLVAQSLTPLPMWLMKRGRAPGVSVAISILIVVLGGLVLVGLFTLSTARLVDQFPTYQAGLATLKDNLTAFLTARGVDVSRIGAFQPLDPNRALAAAKVALSGLASALGTSVLVILIAAVALYEVAAVRALHAKGERPGTLAARFDEVTGQSRQYVALTGLAGLIQAAVNLVILLAAGVDAPLTWAVLFFFLNFVPAVGFLAALVPPAVIALLEHGWQRALIVVGGYWIVNLIGDNVIKPRFFVKGLDLSFTTMVFAIVFWSWVLGAPGTILAVPLALSLKRVADFFPTARPA